MKNKLCGAVLLAVAVLHCVLGDFVLEVQFHEYNNPTSSCPSCLTGGGNQRCCDGVGDCNGGELCDNYFVSCFRAIGSTGQCITNQVTTATFDNNDSINFETEVSLTLRSPGAWEGIQLFTRVWDEDGSTDEFVDDFVIDLSTSFLVPGAGFTAQTVYNGEFGFGQLELSFQVSCAENFTGSDCATVCIPPNNQTICNEEGILVCQPPFFGPNCQFFDNCHLNDDCLPNGRCVDGDNTFTCECNDGFTGDLCQEVDDCFNNDECRPNGQCVDGDNSVSCDCDAGFTGANCMTNINDCSNNDACGSNGQCVDGINTFTCQCGSGFTGANCTTDINDCDGVDCGNGTCEDTGAVSFICQCDEGFTGERCETEIDECQGIDCSGNGQCIDELASFSCNCDASFTGERCETNIDDCASANCSENSQCVDGVNSFTCECSAGFNGTFCENQLPQVDSPGNTNAIIGGVVGAVSGAIALVLILVLVLVTVFRKSQQTGSDIKVEEMATPEQRPSKHAEAATEAEIALSQNPVYGLGKMKMQRNQVYELTKTTPAETGSSEYDYISIA